MEPINLGRLELLAQGKAWVTTWARAADDAVARLTAARQAHDNDGALIAAHELLSAVDRLVGWAIALEPVCDDAFRDRVEQFREQHAELRTARNMHEHLAGYLREQRDRQADPRLSAGVVYRFTDDGSFVIEMVTTDEGSEGVEVRLTDAVGDAFALVWDATKAVDRAVLLGFAPHGAEPPDFGYLHAIEDEDGHFYLSEEPPPGYGPQL